MRGKEAEFFLYKTKICLKANNPKRKRHHMRSLKGYISKIILISFKRSYEFTGPASSMRVNGRNGRHVSLSRFANTQKRWN